MHAVEIASAQGPPLVFVPVADRGVSGGADTDLRKIIDGIRPLG